MFDANQVTDRTQIEETRQNLLSSQSTLLGQINTYQGNIEQYIRFLGLPPDERISISDPLLEQFQLTSPELTVLMEDVADLLAMIRKRDIPLSDDFRDRTRNVVRRAGGEMIVLSQDLDILQRSMPERTRSLRDLEAALAERLEGGERIDPSIYNTATFEERITLLRTRDIPLNLDRLQAAFTLLDLFVNTEERALREMIQNHSLSNPMFEQAVLDALQTLDINVTAETPDSDPLRPQQEAGGIAEQPHTAEQLPPLGPQTPEQALREEQRIEARRIIAELRYRDEYRDWIRDIFSAFQNELVTLSLMQTRTRLDSMTLVPVSITAEEAFRAASEHSLDWMNRKSRFVDTWRQIDRTADALRGVLNLHVDGTTGTIDRRGVHFGRDNSEVQVRLRWDTPLNRFDEMMNYRRSHIAYQNARRDYYLYVDSVQADLRNTIRNLQMSRINFEINRNAVLVGTVRVDVMQLRMARPPARGGRIDTDTSRQLISALDGLLSSQNNLLGTWVSHQTQRMLLDFGMGTMALDDRGRWIDPGELRSAVAAMPTPAPEVRPLPLPLARIEAPRLNRRYVEE
jgi:hypothetical protein